MRCSTAGSSLARCPMRSCTTPSRTRTSFTGAFLLTLLLRVRLPDFECQVWREEGVGWKRNRNVKRTEASKLWGEMGGNFRRSAKV